MPTSQYLVSGGSMCSFENKIQHLIWSNCAESDSAEIMFNYKNENHQLAPQGTVAGTTAKNGAISKMTPHPGTLSFLSPEIFLYAQSLVHMTPFGL